MLHEWSASGTGALSEEENSSKQKTAPGASKGKGKGKSKDKKKKDKKKAGSTEALLAPAGGSVPAEEEAGGVYAELPESVAKQFILDDYENFDDYLEMVISFG